MGTIASTPWTWPAMLGRPRAAAQRRFPSMMMATCLGRSRKGRLDLHHFRFLALSAAVDGLDVPVGQPLEVVQLAALLVLGQVAVAQRVLELVGRFATMIADLDP